MVKFVILLGTILVATTTTNMRNMKATYYSDYFQNRTTASGEKFSQNKYTAATNLYPLGTELYIQRIVRKDTYKVKVRVNDRIAKRYSERIDLSKAAMKQLKGIREGIIDVTVTEVNQL